MNSLSKGMGVLVVGAAAMLWTGTQFFRAESRLDHVTLSAQGPETDTALTTLQQEVTALRNRLVQVEHTQPNLARLQNRLTQLEEKQQNPNETSDPVRSQGVAPAHQEAIDGSGIEQQAAEAEHQQKLTALFATQFSRESDDPAWSRQTEASLSQAVTGASFEGSQLLTTACRTTLCQVEVGHENEAARDGFIQDLPFTLPFDTEVFYQRREGADGTASTVMYLARAGQNLPALAQ